MFYRTSTLDLLLKGPKSAQAAEGDDVLFVCVSDIGTLGFSWEANGLFVSAGNADFSITKSIDSHSASNTSLTVHTYRGSYNETEVRCVIISETHEMEYSPSAILLLQGKGVRNIYVRGCYLICIYVHHIQCMS